MKKYFFSMAICFCGFTQTQAQSLMVGPELGLNITTMTQRVNGSKISNEMLPGLKVGGVLDIGITHHFAVQPGLFFSMKGYKNDYSRTRVIGNLLYTEYYNETVRLNYLEIPINFLYKSGLYSGGRFFIGGGPYVGIATGGSINLEVERELQSNGDGTRIRETSERNIDIGTSAKNDDIMPADAGLNITGGYEFRNGIFAMANMGVGLANIQPGGNDNNYLRNMALGFSVGYLFGK